MAGRGPQSFKKRQKEQQRKEKQQEKLEKRRQRAEQKLAGGDPDIEELQVLDGPRPYDPEIDG